MTAAAARSLARMCAALAARAEDALAASLEGLAGGSEEDARAVEEALLQSYLFLGYPAALNAIALWRRLSGRAAPPPTPDDWAAWTRRGADVCRTVYEGQYEGLRENVRALHPDLERWMVAEGYGKVLGRPGLALAERELCIVAMLAVLDAPRQLHSHLRGALHAGARADDVDAALDEASAFTAPEAGMRARELWLRVRERHASRPDSGRPQSQKRD